MNTKSIFFKIHITFFITFLLLSISVAALYYVLNKREEVFLRKRGIEIAKLYINDLTAGFNEPQLQRKMQRFNFIIIDNPTEIEQITKNGGFKDPHVDLNKGFILHYSLTKTKFYLYLVSSNRSVILLDQTIVKTYLGNTLLLYLSILFIFVFLYYSIIKRLAPLEKLNELVKNIGEEKFDIDYTLQGEDEIANLTREFIQSAQKLNKIKTARNIFIRNMMHELKTPITRGKFLTHLPATEENQEKMQKVFYRLESLISEFAMIEELVSVNKELHVREYNLEDLIDNAIDILMCDEEEVVKDFENKKLKVDFDIFSIALKNILDNGIKYSLNKKVIIKTDGEKIMFLNRSKPLQHNLEEYYEPFFKGENKGIVEGFGLGLYIIKHILDAHSYLLDYKYRDGYVVITIEKSA